MSLGLVLALRVGVRQRVRPVKSRDSVQMAVIVMAVHGAGARPGAGGGGEQTRPGTRQLHAAGVVAGKRSIRSSSRFSNALDGLCTGHLSSSCVCVWLRGESVCRCGPHGNRWTSDRMKGAKNKPWMRPAEHQEREAAKKSPRRETCHSMSGVPARIVSVDVCSVLCRRLTHQNTNIDAQPMRCTD